MVSNPAHEDFTLWLPFNRGMLSIWNHQSWGGAWDAETIRW